MDNVAIKIQAVSKFYKLYNSPGDRLKEALSPFRKVYHKDFYASRNISVEIKKGEILGIVGKNGCGKSTLLKLISGVLTPNEGAITVNGKVSALLELGSGFNPEFTGLQNVFFYGAILGFSRNEMEEKLSAILTFADIGDFMYQQVKTYSSGMRARLGFSVAVHIDPEILILDEVLSVGDVLFQRKCYAKMEEFFKAGKTILYVSHNLETVNELCTRAILLSDGEIVLDGDPKMVTNYYQKLLFSKNINSEDVKNTSVEMKSFNKGKKSAVFDDEYISGMDVESFCVNDSLVTIGEVTIINHEGRVVNCLKINDIYRVRCVATFHVPMNGVSFGMQIQTNKGVVISGANMKDYTGDVISSINQKEEYGFVTEFDCSLLPGVYTVKIYIVDSLNNAAIKNDACMFKVKSGIGKQGGYVTLKQKLFALKFD